MREILFRGKRIDYSNPANNGKWYEGVYFPKDDITPAIIYSGKRHNYGVYVDPETIGQYTGLTDKNGKCIFEGDIVKIDGYDAKAYEVKYRFGQFFVGLNMPIAYKRFDCEVIGNIHDNPELLKGENNV